MDLPIGDIQENVPLADVTSFAVGGPARYFSVVSSEREMLTTLAFARERDLALLVLGGGSNVLVSDDGFPGLVILNRIKGISFTENADSVLVTAGGGEDWQDFVDLCVAKEWQGVECLAGIPGTVGAAPIQNVGAYGQEVSQVIAQVHCLEMATGKVVTFENEECCFRYRESVFNTTETGNYLVLSVTFLLTPCGAPLITYRELAERLSAVASPTLAEVRDTVIAIRASKGVLIRTGYESFKSAGSFFKNPIVTDVQFQTIKALLDGEGSASAWAWPLPNCDVKVSAAYLIQRAGFQRGYRMGKAGISPYHTLILINVGGASARDIVDFAVEVRRQVYGLFGVVLQPETRLIGFESSPFPEQL